MRDREAEMDNDTIMVVDEIPIVPLEASASASVHLRDGDDDRARYLAHLSHDFKGPISAALGFCSLLLDDEIGQLKAEQRDAISSMHRCIQRLSSIAADLFELTARSDFDPVRPRSVGTINGLIEHTLHDLRPIIATKRVRLSIKVRPCREQVSFDAPEIERVIVNLIDNACRFTPSGGSIDVTGYPFFWERRSSRPPSFEGLDQRMVQCSLRNCYRVDVHNNGPEIPEEDVSRIFEEYVAHGEPAGRHSAGLGLAICRAILARHSGHIWAENIEAGPTFSFVIPFWNRSDYIPYPLPDNYGTPSAQA